MLGYLSLDIICSSKLTHFLELCSHKTVCFVEQIMSADKYPSIFLHYLEAIVYIYLFTKQHMEFILTLINIYNHTCTVLSISFEVDVHTGKVGGSLLFERQRRKLPRGVWGHAPQKILKFRCLEMLFSAFSRQYLDLTNNQNQENINHILSLLQPFFSSKSY